MAPELDLSLPPYAQVAATLRAQIASGRLRPGDAVPSVREVAATWGIARATAEKALGLLRVEGLIVTRPGAATVVADAAGPDRSLSELAPQPLYERVADDLRRQIAAGDYEPGDTLPTEAELTATYKVSRDTVRKALTQLTQEGLLAGGGYGRARQVRSYDPPILWTLTPDTTDASDAGDPWSADVTRQGRTPHETVELRLVRPPARVAELLRLDAEDVAVLRACVRFVDGRPHQLANHYFPERIVRGTPLMQPTPVESTTAEILAAHGHTQARYRDEITARMPSETESQRLDLPAGTPVAEVTRTGYATDGSPLHVSVSIAPGDRHRLIYDRST